MAWKRRSPGMSGASIDRIDGGGTTWGIGKTRSCNLNVSASTLVPCESICATQRPGAKRLVANARRRASPAGRLAEN